MKYPEWKKIKRKDPSFYRLALTAGILIFLFFCFLIFYFLKDVAINKQLKTILKQLTLYEKAREATNVPSEKKLQFLSDRLNRLKEIYETLPAEILFENPVEALSLTQNPSLDFKEKLFTLRQELARKAQTKNISFPEKYGLESYESKLPAPNELPHLYFLIEVEQEVFLSLLDAEPKEIKEIQFTETVESEFSSKDLEKQKEHFLKISFTGGYPSLKRFLEILIGRPHIYQILTVDFKPVEANQNKPAEKADKDLFDAEIYLSLFQIKESPQNDPI